MHSLPVFLRLRDRLVILLGEGEAAGAKRRLLERAGAIVCDEAGDARLAIVAIEDAAEAAAAVARLKARGILVNAVDRPALCDITLPAIVDRDPLLIAIGTGGASAGLAKMVRQRIEALLPPGIGRLAAGLAAARGAIRTRHPDGDDRRRALDAALIEGGPLDPFADHGADAVALWLSGEGGAMATGVIPIALRSPDPDDLTLREARLLSRADRIHHRPDVPAAILDRARADAIRVPGDAAPAEFGGGLTLDLGWAGR